MSAARLLSGHCFSSAGAQTTQQDSVRSGVGRDGNPFEYSFELKGSTKTQAVRFAVDVSDLRPVDKTNLLSIASTQQVVDFLAKRSPGLEDTWYRA